MLGLSWGEQTQLPQGMWDPAPRPGIKPASSALEGGCWTTGPPGVPETDLLERDMGENLWDLGIGNELEDLTSKTWFLKGTIYIWASSKLKTFALWRALLRE